QNVLIYRLPADGTLPSLITAKRGQSHGMEWEFEDGWQVEFDRKGMVVTQDRFQDQPLRINLARAVQDFWANQRTAQEMTLSELKQQIDQLGGHTTVESSSLND